LEEFLPKGTIGLSQDTKRRIALILQGTTSGPGTHIRELKFASDPYKREEQVKRFLKLSNDYFSGIIQFIKSEDYIVPIVVNTEAIEIKRRSVSTNTIIIATVILLHLFQFNRGPTKTNLNEKLMATDLSGYQIKKAIRELKDLRWVESKKEGGITYFDPTPVLKACIPISILKEVWEELYQERTDKERLEVFLPKDYLKIQKEMNFSRLDEFQIEKKEENKKNESKEGF